jgi:hypothetical protein
MSDSLDSFSSETSSQPFSWGWVLGSVVIFTAMEIAIAILLAPAIFAGRLASPMLQMRLQMLMHLASFFVGGIGVGIISPRVRMWEPAAGAFIAVAITFMMPFFMPSYWLRFSLEHVAVGGGVAFLLALAGAYTGEKWMGNVENDDSARARVRQKFWGDHGMLSHGDPRLVVPPPSRLKQRR